MKINVISPGNLDAWITRADRPDICPVCGREHDNGILCDDHQHYLECGECGEFTCPEEWNAECRCCVECYERWYGGDENDMEE